MNRENDRESEERFCAVHVVESPFEADIISEVLEREGIPNTCQKHEETAYNGIFVPQKGWGAILVPIRSRDRAQEIIKEVLRTYERP